MTPTLKEQLEQWIDREAITRETYKEELSFRAGANRILLMLLVALEKLDALDCAVECLKEVQTRTAHMQSKHAGKLNRLTTEALNKIKSMMEGN